VSRRGAAGGGSGGRRVAALASGGRGGSGAHDTITPVMTSAIHHAHDIRENPCLHQVCTGTHHDTATN
jgi:hypothetical protein